MEINRVPPAEALSTPSELDIDEQLHLRRTSPEDAAMLEAWLAEPAVADWWSDGQPVGRAEINAKYTGGRLPVVACYIVEAHGQPAGFIQAWQKPEGTRGLDMFIAAAAQGQGIGTRTAKALAEDLTARGWQEITVDPAVTNQRALSAWRAAGFVETGESDSSGGYHTQIMVFRPAKP